MQRSRGRRFKSGPAHTFHSLQGSDCRAILENVWTRLEMSVTVLIFGKDFLRLLPFLGIRGENGGPHHSGHRRNFRWGGGASRSGILAGEAEIWKAEV